MGMFGGGPNVGNKASDFFQSDRDLKEAARRASKRQLPPEIVGSPVNLPAKILAAAPHPTLSGVVYLALANATLREVNLETRKTVWVYGGHVAPVTSVAAKAFENEVYVASGSWDKSVRLWNGRKELLKVFHGHGDFIKSVELGIVNNQLILYSGSSDRDIRKWSRESDASLGTLKGHRGPVEDLKLAPDQQHLFSCSGDLTIRKWCVHTDSVILTIDSHLTTVYRLFITAEDIWSASADKTVRRFDQVTGREDVKLDHPDQVRSLCITPDLRYAVTGCSDEKVRVFDLQTESLVGEFYGHWDTVTMVHCHPSSSTIYSASLDATVRAWNLSDAGKRTAIAASKEGGDSVAILQDDELAELAELMADED
ncbi:hypothetical protein L0F63_002735 [Massospora cicadina]|nr:hypothetical protein L0F63_002735 [Massospora cicadina]